MELEAGEQTRGAEESNKPNDTRTDEGTVADNITHSSADTLEDTNCPQQSKSTGRLQSSTDEPMEINTGTLRKIFGHERSPFVQTLKQDSHKMKVTL